MQYYVLKMTDRCNTENCHTMANNHVLKDSTNTIDNHKARLNFKPLDLSQRGLIEGQTKKRIE